jgi:hypothetical protein
MTTKLVTKVHSISPLDWRITQWATLFVHETYIIIIIHYRHSPRCILHPTTSATKAHRFWSIHWKWIGWVMSCAHILHRHHYSMQTLTDMNFDQNRISNENAEILAGVLLKNKVSHVYQCYFICSPTSFNTDTRN